MRPNNLLAPALLSFTNLVLVSATSDDLSLNNLFPRQAAASNTDIAAANSAAASSAAPSDTTIMSTSMSPSSATLVSVSPTTLPITTPTAAAATITTTLSTTTSLPSSSSSSSTSTATISHNGKNHNIMVGYNSTQFTPSTLKSIPAGDTLTFYFYPTNYSIIQSSFSSPCRPLSDNTVSGTQGIYSGWNPTVDATSGIARSKFVLTLETTDTLWIYAYDGSRAITVTEGSSDAGKGVCELGMAMVVNPGITVDGSGTLSTYKRRAAVLRSGATTVDAKAKLVADLAKVPSGGVWGGVVTGVSDKELARWESKHPWPLNGTAAAAAAVAAGGNGTADDAGDASVAGYTSGSARSGGVARGWNKSSGWVGIFVILGMGVFGLGI